MENGYLNCGTAPASVLGGTIALGFCRSRRAFLGPGSDADASVAASWSLNRSSLPNIFSSSPSHSYVPPTRRTSHSETGSSRAIRFRSNKPEQSRSIACCAGSQHPRSAQVCSWKLQRSPSEAQWVYLLRRRRN